MDDGTIEIGGKTYGVKAVYVLAPRTLRRVRPAGEDWREADRWDAAVYSVILAEPELRPHFEGWAWLEAGK